MKKNSLLKKLESEAISIIRDSFSKSLNPVMMYSIGKDSSVLLHLIRKAFYPSNVPFPLLHIDTKWKFKEMIKFRDYIKNKFKLNIITYTNKNGKELNPQTDKNYTDVMKTQALKDALDKYQFDIIYGGARRDEEASRSKERIVSIRESGHLWNPKNQKPEIWNLYNYEIEKEQTLRVFPLSNWTELDIWNYIKQEKIEIVSLYFSKKRKCIKKDNIYFAIDDDRYELKKDEKIIYEYIRFRTLGCYPLTAGIKSNASTLSLVIDEILKEKNSERSGRLIDLDKLNSMELKKREGYF
ncbi:CysH 3'-phosphoadenosine 5'-phosphosulfate sulfotransferase (PAPS reductase)/FAD synthetase and related enzymes [Candidatus Pelagibacterales bacterium]